MAIHFDTQGPCPNGFHVPLSSEWQAVYDIWTALGGGSSAGTNFGIALKLPFAGYRIYSSAGVGSQGTYGDYWSSSRYDANKAYCLYFDSFGLYPQSDSRRAGGYSVRCFKNTPVIPTSSWTTLYQGTLADSGIFWSSADGLISLSSDGFTWITIADKNLGATTVWNSGDTLSEANCGYYYQRGNNYGFPRTGSVTTSSTQVDASTYGPGNYYSSNTFITRSSSPYSWDSTDNGNLWGGVSQGTWETPDIKLHGAIQTFHRAPHYDGYLNAATIAYYPLTEDLLDHKDNGKEPINLSVSGSGYSFGTNGFGQAGVQLTGSTYFSPGSGNIWGKHPGTDDMTIAFRISGFTSPAYGTYGYSGYHSGILSFDRTFKTGVGSDGVVGRGVGMLDLGYEGFSGETGYSTDDSGNPITVTTPLVSGLSMGQTYGNSFISVVDTFHNGHHTRYISSEGFGVEYPYYESNYGGNKSVSQNYIGRDSYSTSNYRYIHGYMRDFVVAGDVWTPAMINAYFNEDLGGSYQPGTNTIAYYPLTSTSTVNDMSGNGNTLTNQGATFGTYGGVDCMNGTGKSLYGSVTNLPVGNSARTISVWAYWTGGNSWMSIFGYGENTSGKRVNVGKNTSNKLFVDFYNSSVPVDKTFTQNSWGLYTFTHDGTTAKAYFNGSLLGQNNVTLNTSNSNLVISGWGAGNETFAGYISEFILENKARTASEIADYYNNIKSNYGL